MPPPESIIFEGHEVPCWTYEALERLGKPNLKQRAMNLRDQVGANRLPPLRLSAQPPSIIRWILIAQCTIAEAVGMDMTLSDWGAPAEVGEAEEREPYFGPKSAQGSRPGSARAAPPPTPPAPYATLPDMPPPPMPPMPPMPPAPLGAPAAPGNYALPPYGHDDGLTMAPQRRAPSAGGAPDPRLRNAHEDAAAGMRSARQRNEGSSLVLGGDASWADAPRPPSSRGGLSARGGGPPVGGYQHYTETEQRPGSAASTQAYEDSSAAYHRFRAKNQGSFAFG